MEIKDVVNDVRSNVLISVKVVTNGTFQVNDNMKVVDKLKEMGFEFDGEPITQDNGDVAWTMLMMNKGFKFEE